jgi:hypothetical protein
MSETKIYSVERNESLDLNQTNLGFWLDLFKKNSVVLYEESKMSILEVSKLINETLFTLEKIFDDNKLIFEFSNLKKQIVLSEEFDRIQNSNLIKESWDFIINYQNKFISDLIQEEESWWDKTVSGAKKLYTKAKEKVSGAIDWVKKKGLSYFFEGLRTALFSWGGAAVTTFLTTVGSAAFGLGPTLVFVTWAAMLGYDLYLGISQNQWNYVNIIIDLLGALTAGPGAKIAHVLFKGLGLVGKAAGGVTGNLKKLISTMMRSKQGSTAVSKILQPIVNGIGTIVKYLSQAANWLSKQLGIPFLKQKFGQIKSWVDKISGEISTAISQSKTAQVVANKSTKTKNVVGNVIQNTKNKYQGLSRTGKATVAAAGVGAGTAALTALTGPGVNNKNLQVFGGAFQNPTQDELDSQYAGLQNVDWSSAELPPEDLI